MVSFETLTKEIQDLEIHFAERIDDGADSKELIPIFSQIESLKEQLNLSNGAQTAINNSKTTTTIYYKK